MLQQGAIDNPLGDDGERGFCNRSTCGNGHGSKQHRESVGDHGSSYTRGEKNKNPARMSRIVRVVA